MLKIVFTLFNLQGTDALPKGSFWIISHSIPFVKNFFRSFPNFFEWILPSLLSWATRLFYHIFLNLSRTFFASFRSFSSCDVALQASALHHATFSLYLIKFHLSRTFSNSPIFSLTSAWFSCPRGQPRYITISHSICQAFFNKNWLLFLCSLIVHICISITDNS